MTNETTKPAWYHDLPPLYESGPYSKRPLPHADVGFGRDDRMFVASDMYGPIGTVCAANWYDAWGEAEDSLFYDVDDDADAYARSYDDSAEEGELAEGVSYRPNGTPTNGLRSSHLTDTTYARLEELSPAVAERLHIRPILPGSEHFPEVPAQ